MKILITIDNIRSYRPIASQIKIEQLSPYIIEAQMNDLKPVLGEQLFWDFMNKFDVSADPLYGAYQKLLNGESYTPTGYASAITYEGIIPMICYYALARFFENNPVHATRFGIVQKQNENFSEPVSPQVLSTAIGSIKSMGLAYQQSVKKFLESNVTTYTLYQYVDGSKVINKTGVKFFDI